MKGADAWCLHRHFDPGGPFTFTMDRHYLVYALQGVMRLEVVGRVWTLTPARAASLRAGAAARVTVVSRLESASALFRPGFVELPGRDLVVFDMPSLGRELVRECRQWSSECAPLDAYARAIFRALAEVARRAAAAPTPCVLPTPASPALLRAVRLTEAGASSRLELSTIARESGQSTRALSRRFRAELGMTWTEYLRRVRLIRAAEALAGDDTPVTTVAMMVGYDSISGFNAAFRDLTGMTPSAYRASCRGGA